MQFCRGGGGGGVVVVGELGVFLKKRGAQLQKWNVKKLVW